MVCSPGVDRATATASLRLFPHLPPRSQHGACPAGARAGRRPAPRRSASPEREVGKRNVGRPPRPPPLCDATASADAPGARSRRPRARARRWAPAPQFQDASPARPAARPPRRPATPVSGPRAPPGAAPGRRPSGSESERLPPPSHSICAARPPAAWRPSWWPHRARVCRPLVALPARPVAASSSLLRSREPGESPRQGDVLPSRPNIHPACVRRGWGVSRPSPDAPRPPSPARCPRTRSLPPPQCPPHPTRSPWAMTGR